MAKKDAAATKVSPKQTKAIRFLVDDFIAKQQNNTYNYRQVSHALGIGIPAHQRAVALYLAELAFDGDLLEVAPGKYKSPQRNVIATGTFVRRSNGKNAVITDQDGETIMVPERNSMHALNGDKVAVTVAARRKGVEPEAVVTEIIEENPQTFIGTISLQQQFGVLHTDSKFLATDIIIPRKQLKGAKNGDKAVVRITEWPENQQSPFGKVEDVLGRNGENDTEMHAILAEYGLPYKYPQNVEKAADKIGPGITDEEVAKRIDMRDVTHYVRPESIIDREAQQRATSVYLVDRTIPMLPEHLSNGICSLRPDEDKLTFSVLFEMTPAGKVVKSKIARTVTRSNRRFTYEEAQERIETGKGDYTDEILILDRMAKALRKERYEHGSVEFDRMEVRFEIDENGHPVDVYFKESKDANKLIEEFMLLANKTVASFVGKPAGNKKPKAFVYRVHDQPDPGKLADLAALSRTFGYKIKASGSAGEVNRSLNRMLNDVKGKGEENFLSTLAIRSMAKAIYTTQNIGHYGLGFDYYTHFTSPIRRYPDMMVHRLLERYLKGGRTATVEKLEEQCKHSSEMEQLAATAERSSIKYKQVEYMADHLGEVYDGVISGVTEWGLYVEINDNKCEGLVPMRDLADDYYDFDEKNYCLVGRRHNNRYRLGDAVKVQVARAALDKRQLDFVIVDEKNPPRTLATLGSQPSPAGRQGKKNAKGKQKSRSRK